MATKKRPEKKKTVRTKRKKTINAKIKLQDWWLLCCLNTPESIRSAYSNNLRMCVYACEDVCVYVCVCMSTPAHSSIVLLHGPVTAPSLQFHPSALPDVSYCPEGWCWCGRQGGGGGEQGRAGDYTHYLSESSSDRTAAILYLLSADFNI